MPGKQPPKDLEERTYEFARDVRDFVKELPEDEPSLEFLEFVFCLGARFRGARKVLSTPREALDAARERWAATKTKEYQHIYRTGGSFGIAEELAAVGSDGNVFEMVSLQAPEFWFPGTPAWDGDVEVNGGVATIVKSADEGL